MYPLVVLCKKVQKSHNFHLLSSLRMYFCFAVVIANWHINVLYDLDREHVAAIIISATPPRIPLLSFVGCANIFPLTKNTTLAMSSTIPHYKVERVFEAPTLVTSISFSQDGLLLAAGFSNIARIWSIDSGRVAHNLVMDDEIVTVVWGPGNILYCGIASGYLVFKVIDNTNKVCGPFRALKGIH